MGPIAWAITSRWRLRLGPDASRSHTPPPKSAPANRTYAFSDSASSAARISGRPTSGTADPRRPVAPPPVGRAGTPDDLAVEQPDNDDSEKAIEQGKE